MARVLIYGINYAPEPTGIGKYTGEMAEWLARRGHEVEVISTPPHYPWWKIQPPYRSGQSVTETINGVRVHRVPLFVPPAEQATTLNRIRLESSFTLNALRPWLPVLLGARRPDVVIAISVPLQIALYPWLLHVLHRTPWVFHIQDLQVDAAFRLGMLKGSLVDRLLFGLENFFLRRATRVSTITEAMRRRVVAKGVGGDRTLLFPNWSDTDHIRPLPRDNAFRKRLELGPDDLLFMYAGNMGEKQGLDLVLAAAERLRERRDIHFAMIGAGAARDRLAVAAQRQHLDNVRFLPLQPVEQLPEVLAAADVHLVVQKAEAADLVMPSKLTNILAAGRPSIATANEGTELHHVLTSYDAGLVTSPDDVVSFLAAITTLAADPARRSSMGLNARRYAERHLAQDAVLSEFEVQLITLAASQSQQKIFQERGK